MATDAEVSALGKDGLAVELNWSAFQRARDNGHSEYTERADKCNKFYMGEQWSEATLAELRAGNRPAQTVNLILSTINAVIGEQINSRQEISFKPASNDANAETAHALSIVFKQIEHNNQSRFVETGVVSDGLIEERGYFDIRMDYSDNVFGEVREIQLDPRDVMLDPGAKEYDPETWSEITVTRWMTPDEIEALYGKTKADQLRYLDADSSYGIDSVLFDSETFAGDKHRHMHTGLETTTPDEYRRVRRVRVIDRQFRRLGKCEYFVDPIMGDTRAVPKNWNRERASEFAKKYGMLVRSRMERKIHWTVSADKVMLFDDVSPYKHFTVVPFFPYFRRGRPFGMVTNLIGPQDTLNKVISQELHVVNTSANSGWTFQSGSLVNMTAEQLMQVGAKTGLVLEYARGFDKPEKIQPNQVPTGLDRISEKTSRYFREISGVSDAMLGQPGREISGVALDQKRKGGLTQLEIVFDNLARTRAMRGRVILDMVQKFYTEERLMRITQRTVDGDEETIEMVANQQTPEGTIANDLMIGEYNIVITSANLRENDDETTFAQLMQLREAGVMVPDWAILECTNIRNKADLVQYAKQIAGAMEPTPEEQEMAALMQQLEMESAIATTEDLKAQAQERMANVQLLIAQAEKTSQEIPLALQALQQDAALAVQALEADLMKAEGELNARMQIAEAKSRELMHQTNMSTLTKRLDTESKERNETVKTLSGAASDRQKSIVAAMTAERANKSRERVAQLQAQVKARADARKKKAAQKK